MIGSKSWNDLMNCNQEECRNYFISKMSDKMRFNDIHTFPKKKGLYFVYNDTEVCQAAKQAIYIGKADVNERNIRKRCQQYLQKGNGGDSIKRKLQLIMNYNDQQTIDHIRHNFWCRFIIYTEESNIPQLEQVAIWAFQPILNFIKKDFTFEHISKEV